MGNKGPVWYAYFKRKSIVLNDMYTRWRRVSVLVGLSKGGKRRLEWIIYYETQGFNVSLTCRHFGIARKTFYKYLNRFDSSDLHTLEDRSCTPHHLRTRTITPLEEERVISLRKAHLYCGKEKLRALYRQHYGEDLSAHKILYTIQKHQLYPSKRRQERLVRIRQRYRHKRKIQELKTRNTNALGWLVQLDTIVLHLGGLKRYVLTAIDRFGKLAFARVYRNHSSVCAADFLKRLQFLLEDTVVNIQTDHGSEFAKYFEGACTELHITHYFSRVRTPKDNAVVERFNRTLQEEWLNNGQFHPDTHTMNTALTDWLVYYNYTRPHRALDNLSPMDYCVKTGRVLPMYPTENSII